MANNYSLIVKVENLNLKDLNELSKKVFDWEDSTMMGKYTHIQHTYIDPVGGTHSNGEGISPFGDRCGECSYVTCEDCKHYREGKREGRKTI